MSNPSDGWRFDPSTLPADAGALRLVLEEATRYLNAVERSLIELHENRRLMNDPETVAELGELRRAVEPIRNGRSWMAAARDVAGRFPKADALLRASDRFARTPDIHRAALSSLVAPLVFVNGETPPGPDVAAKLAAVASRIKAVQSAALARLNATANGTAPEPAAPADAPTPRPKAERKRGRKPAHDPGRQRRVCEAWRSGLHATKAALAKAFGIHPDDVKRMLDNERKARYKAAKASDQFADGNRVKPS